MSDKYFNIIVAPNNKTSLVLEEYMSIDQKLIHYIKRNSFSR